ncbi:DUF4120 family protein [uncultured Alistipes sp.]|uniref:DUF4120 family protein n=1 Tax=uncultured Alistipes sp. TaxID=538949 RepID=UPI00272D6B62|nr:DUF4120 family protein [uncultured Alistipes sp.]
MHDRIIVHIDVNECSLAFRTRQGNQRSPHRFYVTRGEFDDLKRAGSAITADIHSFARLRLDRRSGLLEMDFTWLSGGESDLRGFSQTVRLPWERIRQLLDVPYAEDLPSVRLLSLPPAARRPRLVFDGDRANLKAAIGNPRVRRKLGKALMANFNWPGADEVRLYNDFTPYSFFFREVRDGKPCLCGGLILHGQEDMRKAYYGIHT